MIATVKKTYKILLAAGLIIGGLYLGFLFFTHLTQQIAFNQRKAAWGLLKQKIFYQIKGFNGEAGIVIKDLRFDREFAYKKNKLFPSASLAKVPIMCACFLAVQDGRIKLDRPVALKSGDKLSGSGILQDVRPGTIFTVEELIGLMIYDSDNTATNILTNLVGLDYLNRAFSRLGLTNTDLSRRIADYRLRNQGIENYTSAQDIAWLLERIYRRKLINREFSEQCLRILKLQRVNDRIPRYLPVEVTVAHKTGLERNVCHDAGIVFSAKGDLLICVLTKHNNPNALSSKNFIAQVSQDAYAYTIGSLLSRN
jgi:beta-lactamase class A